MKNKQFKELAVCGFEAVKAIERTNSDKIRRLYFTADRAKAFGSLCKKIATRKGVYNLVENSEELEKLSGTIHHQGVVAMMPLPEIPVVNKEYVDEAISKKKRILVLDRIGNSNNFGAIIRSAAFFGIKDIIISGEEAQTTITTSTYRIAQGGMEFVSIYQAFSLPWILEQLGKGLPILGTDVHGKLSLNSIASEIKKDSGAVLVLGNEENGISDEVKAACTILVTIPGTGNIESLNVAQAACLFLYALKCTM